ncbi:MAG: DUF4160 domain-containing protein [Pirellulales bacterium]
MPRIKEFYGIPNCVYWQDHAPPHFHAIYAGQDAAISIATGDLIEGTLPRRAQRMVREWALQHEAELGENWERAQRGDPLLWVPPLE